MYRGCAYGLGHTKDNLVIICLISTLLNENKKGKLISREDDI